MANRVQLTGDAMSTYPAAVAKHFGSIVDFAVLNKSYEGGMPQVEAKRRYVHVHRVGAENPSSAVAHPQGTGCKLALGRSVQARV